MTPKVSIVVPVWNEEKYLEKSLDTIRCQTFEDFEVIIVDDCSTDRTPKIIKYFETLDPRFRSIRLSKNSGTGTALNAGFKEAVGKYQTWLSGDSWVMDDAIEKLTTALDKTGPEIVLVYADWLQVDDVFGVVEERKNPEYNKKALQDFCYLGPSWLWRKEAKDKAGEYCAEICEDYYMHLLLSEQGDFQHVPKTLGIWRNHAENLTNKVNNPEGWTQSVVARAMARWTFCKYRAAYISQTYTSEGWKFVDMMNKITDDFSYRHITYEQRHDFTIGEHDEKIEEILKECDVVILWGVMPDCLKDKIHCPIVGDKWTNDQNLVPEYEQRYKDAINGTIRKQQSKPTLKPTGSTA